MTAIIGLVDEHGNVHMGGDSAGTTNQGDQSVLLNQKVFSPEHGPWFLFGCCGTFRLAQVLQYAFVPPLPPGPKVSLEAFMATVFVESVKKLFRQTGLMHTDNTGAEVGHTFLVGYQGRVFKIEDNFQVLADARKYTATGTGESVALGALYATDGLAPPEQRIQLALSAAAHYNAMVREPFHVHSLPFREDWYKDVKPKKKKNAKKKAKPQ